MAAANQVLGLEVHMGLRRRKYKLVYYLKGTRYMMILVHVMQFFIVISIL